MNRFSYSRRGLLLYKASKQNSKPTCPEGRARRVHVFWIWDPDPINEIFLDSDPDPIGFGSDNFDQSGPGPKILDPTGSSAEFLPPSPKCWLCHCILSRPQKQVDSCKRSLVSELNKAAIYKFSYLW
jgi:hypothetical protein